LRNHHDDYDDHEHDDDHLSRHRVLILL